MNLSTDNGLGLREFLDIYGRRKTTIYATMLFVFLLCITYCAVSTREYQSTGTIQINKESSDGLGLDSLLSGADGASDALEANVIIQTQATILQSDTLALRTIEALNLEKTDDFAQHWNPNPLGFVLGLFEPKGKVHDSPGASLADSPERRSRAIATFAKYLTVKPIPGTRLIEIDYLSSDPAIAAAVVNQLASELLDYTFQTRYHATNQASTWLTGQLGELRKQSETLQANVVSLERASGVYSLGTVDATGKEQAYSGVLDRLQQDTLALTQAQQARIIRGAIAKAAESGDAETLSSLAGNGAGATSPALATSLTLIQSLRNQEASEKASLREAEAKYGSAYPKLDEMQGNVASLEASIAAEISRIKERAQTDFQVSVEAEARTKLEYEKARQEADSLNNKAIDYVIAKQEAQQSNALYEDLLRRLKEAGVLEGLKSSNITVVDPGRVPARPSKPNIPKFLFLGLFGGAVLGFGLALAVDALDNKVNTVRDLEEVTKQSLLGATPYFEGAISKDATRPFLASLDDPTSTYTESIRGIRTSLLLSGGGGKSRSFLVTSSIGGEGKTTLSTNLAIVMAQTGRRVLLVDMDMRRSAVRKRLNLTRTAGLSELLAGQMAKPELHKLEAVPSLDILQAGGTPPNPSELLNQGLSRLLQEWLASYDFLILDGPPLLPVTDSLVVNPLIDATILLARARVTERSQVERSLNMLTTNSTHFVGIVLNCLRPEDRGYYDYYGSKKYSYNYGEGSDDND